MAQRRHGVVRRSLLLVALLVLIVVAGGPLAASTGPPFSSIQVPRGLGLRPVLRTTEGPCPAPPSNTVVGSSGGDSCLTVSATGLRIERLTSARVFRTQVDTWDLRLVLDADDAARFDRLCARLRLQPGPRNELAIVLHGPPGGQLLAAPVIGGRLHGTLELYGGATAAEATALLEAITR